MLHEVGDTYRSRATPAIFAVDDGAPAARSFTEYDISTAVEVLVQVLVGVVINGHAQSADPAGRIGLLLGHVNAEGHCLLLEELNTAG